MLTKVDLRRLRRLAEEEINRLLHWARTEQPDDSHLSAQRQVDEWEECLLRLDEQLAEI